MKTYSVLIEVILDAETEAEVRDTIQEGLANFQKFPDIDVELINLEDARVYTPA